MLFGAEVRVKVAKKAVWKRPFEKIRPIYFCWVHLHKQLYRLYLSRGGEPVPLSPKLNDIPAPA